MEERHLEKAKQHASFKLHQELKNIGATAVHEDEYNQEVSSVLQSAHPDAGTSKDAVVVTTEPTPNLVSFPNKSTGAPMGDTSWGFVRMAQKLKERFERRRQKGELPNAA